MKLYQRDRPGSTYLQLDVNAEPWPIKGSSLKIGVFITVSLLVRTTGRGSAIGTPALSVPLPGRVMGRRLAS